MMLVSEHLYKYKIFRYTSIQYVYLCAPSRTQNTQHISVTTTHSLQNISEMRSHNRGNFVDVVLFFFCSTCIRIDSDIHYVGTHKFSGRMKFIAYHYLT